VYLEWGIPTSLWFPRSVLYVWEWKNFLAVCWQTWRGHSLIKGLGKVQYIVLSRCAVCRWRSIHSPFPDSDIHRTQTELGRINHSCLSWFIWILSLHTCYSQNHFIVSLSHMPRSSTWPSKRSVIFRLSAWNVCIFITCRIYVTRIAHLILFLMWL
jgi:hypothetical protein